MSAGAWMMTLVFAITFGSLFWLVFAMVRTIRDERTKGKSIWRQFGLSIALMLLFFTTWIAHGISQWQSFTDEQRQHDQPVELGDFVDDFARATLENWQSEFLQLFSFVSLAALYIHKGSSESKDGDEKLEASLRRLEEKLGTLPDGAPKGKDKWKLPDAPPVP